MKDRTPEQLKGQIRSFASKRNLQPQEATSFEDVMRAVKEDGRRLSEI